jgi:hypothetical protein
LSENPLDHIDGNAINAGDLGSRHTVFDPDADARELRLRDLRRYPLLGGDDVKSASAARRALVLRSRSSSRGDSGRLRSSKIPSEWLRMVDPFTTSKHVP